MKTGLQRTGKENGGNGSICLERRQGFVRGYHEPKETIRMDRLLESMLRARQEILDTEYGGRLIKVYMHSRIVDELRNRNDDFMGRRGNISTFMGAELVETQEPCYMDRVQLLFSTGQRYLIPLMPQTRYASRDHALQARHVRQGGERYRRSVSGVFNQEMLEETRQRLERGYDPLMNWSMEWIDRKNREDTHGRERAQVPAPSKIPIY